MTWINQKSKLLIMNKPCLSKGEIEEITGLKRPQKQLEWLLAHGFTATIRADGSVLMSRQNFEIVMGGVSALPVKAQYELDFSSFSK